MWVWVGMWMGVQQSAVNSSHPLPQAPKTTYRGPPEKESIEKMRETAKKRAEVGMHQVINIVH